MTGCWELPAIFRCYRNWVQREIGTKLLDIAGNGEVFFTDQNQSTVVGADGDKAVSDIELKFAVRSERFVDLARVQKAVDESLVVYCLGVGVGRVEHQAHEDASLRIKRDGVHDPAGFRGVAAAKRRMSRRH